MKTSLKKRLRILLIFFAIIPIHPVTWKKGILVGAEERDPRPSSHRDARIYSLAVPVLNIWSFHVVVVQEQQRNVQKSVMHVQSCCFAHQTYCFFWRSCCRRRRSFVRSLLGNNDGDGNEKATLIKSEVALLETLSRLFHLVQFIKCWQLFKELNSKRLYQSSGEET